MKRADLIEAHFIALIVNVPSIITHGILSNTLAAKVHHESCASQGVQERRDKVILPNGKRLHDYANVYINARNPMMYLLKESHSELCVLAISSDILDIPGVIITDQNASRRYALFQPAPDGLGMIDKDRIFAEYWTHDEGGIEEYEHKGIMCAEILVPSKIDPCYIMRAYVSSSQSQVDLEAVLGTPSRLSVVINGHLFFR